MLLIFFTHLIVASFLVTVRSGNRLSNRIFGGFLLVTALDLSNFLFPSFYHSHLNLDMTRANTSFLIAPLLYFYVRSVIHSDFRLKWRQLWHTGPFLLSCLILLPGYYLVDVQGKLAFYEDLHNQIEIMAISILVHVQLALYLGVCFRILIRHRKVLVDHFSDPNKLNTNWLIRLVQLYTVNYVIVLTRNVLKFRFHEDIMATLTSVMLLVTLSFSIWILFQVLRKPSLFQGIESKLEPSETLIKQMEVEKPSAPELVLDEGAKEQIAQLRAHMEKHQPYLVPTLTIEALAEQLDMSVSELSFLINRHMNQHFFDLINEYRINAAAFSLSDPEQKSKTVLDILYEVGFNSKSSFNTAFKKQMLMTPTQYRQSKL